MKCPLADEAFHENISKNRIVALLSPATAADLADTQLLQALLMEYENDTLDARVVWQPMVQTDWAPTTDAMARVWDPRARHDRDQAKTLRALVGEGRIFVYARGPGINNPAVRVTLKTAVHPRQPRPAPMFTPPRAVWRNHPLGEAQ